MNKRILTLQDFSSVGKCSLTAALPILTACGIDAVGLPTAILSTQTGGLNNYTFTDLSTNIIPAYRHWQSLELKFDCLYTGFLGTVSGIDAATEIAYDFKKNGQLLAVDPCIADNGELYAVFDDIYRDKMFELCAIADIITPNFTEAKMLAGLNMTLYPNEENARMIMNMLLHKGFKTVLISGIYKDGEVGAALLEGGKSSMYFNTAYKIEVHGGGDCLTSVFLGKLFSGKTAAEAAASAVNFCKATIETAAKENIDTRFGLPIEKTLHLLNKN